MLAMPFVLVSAGWWRGHFTGQHCARIARRMPLRICSALYGHFIPRYPQLIPEEEVFFGVVHVVRRMLGRNVRIDFVHRCEDVLERVVRSDEPWIVASPHYPEYPLLHMVAQKFHGKMSTCIAADAEGILGLLHDWLGAREGAV